MAVTVLLVDDNALFRDGIAEILQVDGRFEVVGQAARGDDGVAAAARLQPDLILMDLNMPGMTGDEAIRLIRRANAEIAIGVLTMFETQDYIKSALDAGASGYLLKDAKPADFCEAAMALAMGKRDVVPHGAGDSKPASASKALSALTTRELEVLRLLTTGASNEAIAQTLAISPTTLRNHISNIYRKLRINDRVQAVIVAVREGLVEVKLR
jgi:DNA-binding NarL/FixJ family response regulator